jgi:hypothetical protein
MICRAEDRALLSCDAVRAFCSAGRRMAMRRAMMEITTRSSIRVNAWQRLVIGEQDMQ